MRVYVCMCDCVYINQSALLRQVKTGKIELISNMNKFSLENR